MPRIILVLPEDAADAKNRISGIMERWKARELYDAPEIAVVYTTLLDAIENGLYRWGAINFWSVSRELLKRHPEFNGDIFERCCDELVRNGGLTVLEAPLGN